MPAMHEQEVRLDHSVEKIRSTSNQELFIPKKTYLFKGFLVFKIP